MANSKDVVVTGVSTGIGWGTTKVLVSKGFRVFGSVRKQADADRLQREFGNGFVPLLMDITDADAVHQAAQKVGSMIGDRNLVGLVNNAGIQKPCASHEMQASDFDRVLAVNLRGPFLCSREAIRHFLPRGAGVILNNSSVHEIIPKPKYLSYSISKGGMENLTKTLALEYAGSGIRVNAVLPGIIRTPMIARLTEDARFAAFFEKLKDRHPIGRFGEPSEIGEAVKWLLSDAASFMNGAAMACDGGYLSI